MAYRLARRRRAQTRRWRLRWITRAVAVTALAASIVVASAQAGQAAPDPAPRTSTSAAVTAPVTTGPQNGALPAPTGPIAFPPKPAPINAAAAAQLPPLARQLMEAEAAYGRLSDQLRAMDEELAAAQAVTAQFRAAYDPVAAHLAVVKARAAEIMANVYKDAAALGPFQEYADEASDLGLLVPMLPEQLGQNGRPQERDTIGLLVAAAEAEEREARAAVDAALAAEAEVAGRRAVVAEQFELRKAALETLNNRDSAQTAAARAAREAYEETLAITRGAGTSVNGLKAAPAALAAVSFALSQLGKDYEWAAEGPNTYDCSGLMYASYRTVGITLPRVSRYQWSAGTFVLPSQLLPGDLLFFSTDSNDWRQVHHVGMYIGDGQMVHAPTFNEKVKKSPIWWSGYFGAKRIVPAIATATTTTPPATTRPAATTTPPATTAPATTTPPATTSPTPSATPTAAPTTPAGTPPPDEDPTTPPPDPDTETTEPPAETTQAPATGLPSATAAATSAAAVVGRRRRLFGWRRAQRAGR